MGYSFLEAHLYSLWHIVMLIGQGVRIPVDLLQVGVCFSAMPSFLGNLRSMIVFLNLLLRLNIIQCLLLVLKLCCYTVFWRSLDFHSLTLPLFILIIQVLFRLLQIPCFTNEPSILRLIVIILRKPWPVKLSHFLTSPQIFKWLISLPKLWLDSVISFLLTNCCWLTYQHQFEGGC